MKIELNQEQALLLLRGLDRLNISKYAYPVEYKEANMLMDKLHKELRILENEIKADKEIEDLTKDYGDW